LFILLIGLASRSVRAGETSTRQSYDQPVRLDVLVLDRHGQPVINLDQDDFKVFDGGKSQRILYFRPPRVRQDTAAPNVYANQLGPGLPTTTIILLDLLNAKFMLRANGWREIIHAVDGLKSSDNVYLYLLTIHGKLYPVHPLSPVTGRVRPSGLSWAEKERVELARLMREQSGLRSVDEEDPGERTDWTMRALTDLGGRMSAVPGRKSLVWISHGFPAVLPLPGNQWFDSTPYLRALSNNFANSQIVVYTVDQWLDGVGSPGSLSTDTLQLLSDLTGGRAYASDRTETAIAQAIDDAASFYTIGYFPQLVKADGKFHKLRVTIDRSGVRAQTRGGYFANTVSQSVDERTMNLLRQAAAALGNEPGISLRASLKKTADSLDNAGLTIRVDLTDLWLTARNHRHHAQIELAVAGYRNDGVRELLPATRIDLDLSDEELNQDQKNGLELTRNVSLDNGLRGIRIILVDRLSGNCGSLDIPLAGTS